MTEAPPRLAFALSPLPLDEATEAVIEAAFRVQDDLLHRARWTAAERALVECLNEWMASRLAVEMET
jgi:hypothetical protein